MAEILRSPSQFHGTQLLSTGEDSTTARYVIKEKLSSGEFGTVVRALDRVEKTTKIIKLGPPMPAQSDDPHGKVYDPTRLLFNGVQAMISAGSPLLLDLAVCRDPWDRHTLRPMVTMLDGGIDLRSFYLLFRTAPKNAWPTEPCMPPSLCYSLGMQMLAEVRALHMAGLLHRDIKPANFCISLPKGFSILNWSRYPPSAYQVRLIDYDFAIESGQAPTCFLGTPSYASAAQLVCETLGPRDDLEGLGLTILSVLMGGRMWEVTYGVEPGSAGCWSYSQMRGMAVSKDKIFYDLCLNKKIPSFMLEWLCYCRRLAPRQPPDYLYLEDLLESIVRGEGLAPHPRPQEMLDGICFEDLPLYDDDDMEELPPTQLFEGPGGQEYQDQPLGRSEESGAAGDAGVSDFGWAPPPPPPIQSRPSHNSDGQLQGATPLPSMNRHGTPASEIMDRRLPTQLGQIELASASPRRRLGAPGGARISRPFPYARPGPELDQWVDPEALPVAADPDQFYYAPRAPGATGREPDVYRAQAGPLEAHNDHNSGYVRPFFVPSGLPGQENGGFACKGRHDDEGGDQGWRDVPVASGREQPTSRGQGQEAAVTRPTAVVGRKRGPGPGEMLQRYYSEAYGIPLREGGTPEDREWSPEGRAIQQPMTQPVDGDWV